MKDSQGNLVQGRTRWRRFAAVALPAALLGAGLMAGVANGVVPVSFTVSGDSFKVSASSLEGDNFAQYGGVALTKGANPACNTPDSGCLPVLISAIDDATLEDLCQSVKDPAFGISMVIRAGGGSDAVRAHHLLIGMDALSGDAEFTNINIGQDASTVSTFKKGAAGDFAQQADHVSLTDLKQTAYSTQAGTFTLPGLSLKLSLSGEECFTGTP